MKGALRRTALRVAVGVVAMGTVVGLTGSATGEAGRSRSPVGTWAVKITFEGSSKVEHMLFALERDGSFELAGLRTGLGTWQPTPTGFRYAFRHYDYDDAGVFDWELRGVQEGALTSADTFTSNGTGTSVDADGTVQGVFRTKVEARRFSIQSP
ncbi:hypothetical protein DP939_06895 [Spongiactinospora rosea]|uniref:Uncharacterized protein n=1 Tax=Spongiactinospora rosea TaxID=2248750 RepID=A0A366M3H6_9ACTN|nr:hypothetical protein DP939_06895 [Spongiactinospora rosea]